MTQEEYEEIIVEKLTPIELVEYSRYGEVAIIEELARQSLNNRIDAALDSRSNTMLHKSAANGHIDCVQALLKYCTDKQSFINKCNLEGNSALHWACICGQLETVKILVGQGSDLSIENAGGRTAMCEAQAHNRSDIVDYFTSILDTADGEVPSNETADDEIASMIK